tara:strand:+ start:8263 stop:8829 length:567 start_codon:yes stop_codon:yes gene_type:complete
MYLLIITYLFAAKQDFVDVLSPAIKSRTMDLNYYKKDLKDSKVLESMDSQDEGKPDTFLIYVMRDGAKILLMHLFDLNRDGKIDVAKHFKNSKMYRTETILDREGKIFAITEYNPDTGNEIKKVTFDHEVMTTRLSYKNQLRREEIDRNLDGKTDMWVHYREGQVVKSEVDEDFDGENIRIVPGEKVE